MTQANASTIPPPTPEPANNGQSSALADQVKTLQQTLEGLSKEFGEMKSMLESIIRDGVPSKMV